MNKDQLHELLMGVAVVALGYALYKHFKPAAKAPAGAPAPSVVRVPTAINPSQGIAYNPANPGQYISINDLLAGTVHDLATTPGGTAGYIPSTDEQISAVTGYDTSGNDSIVKPDAWWYNGGNDE